jgi:hypothetical protein
VKRIALLACLLMVGCEASLTATASPEAEARMAQRAAERAAKAQVPSATQPLAGGRVERTVDAEAGVACYVVRGGVIGRVYSGSVGVSETVAISCLPLSDTRLAP